MTRPTDLAPTDLAPAAGTGTDLLLRVLSTLLREDVVGWRTRSEPVRRPDGLWLRLRLRLALPARGAATGDALLMAVHEDGFQGVYAARLPLLLRESDGSELGDAHTVMAALRDLADPADRAGFDAFAEECGLALDAVRLHAETREEVDGLLTDRFGKDPATWTGLAAGLGYDTLAARADHPVYPTSRGRSGLSVAQLRSYAPEFHPRFALRRLAVPREDVTVGGGTDTWLSPLAAGLPQYEGSHYLFPVHPLTVGGPLRDALRAAGLDGRAELLDGPGPDVVPTLSMRTVARTADASHHLKLPLATATLGLRNRRTIKPGTLVDGAAGQRLIESVIAREPRFQGVVLHADETRYAHAGHELLAVLLRRYPAGLDEAVVVPMAALLCPVPGGAGPLLIDRLAERFHGGDPLALLDAALTLLFDWQTTLFAYGIALESHQQNISLVLDEEAPGRTRLRLLLKDNDGPRIHHARLRDVMGEQAPDPREFDDARIFVDGDGPVLDLFTTITVHLCAGAYAFGLARHGHAPLDRLLRLVRDRLAEAVARLGTGPGEPGAPLRTHVLDAAELPVKAMVTAGTLLSKERSGAADINKHYTTGPNYLLRRGTS
ncbi:IucA/IucC family siderophore biosynthesis protein [Streptomyces sp. MZ04]|uniref:IucA/IucC family protein n=1 Tax=Streptomyces sp. MZ04 TaxID=2559236 RepID=UPI00107E9E6F|nr:IucA/IucC family siderophore biosynthesis protein [Streptomyces sp. MZ04]TGB14711.1 IucA/IucC family siderophore biosynthesis protein [Streptomyces sp. MZ04]